MRKQCMIWLILAACLTGVLVYGQSSKRASRRGGRNDMPFSILEDNIKIDITLQRPPVYVTDSRKNRIGTNVPDTMRQWLMAEISFSFTNRSRLQRPIVLEKMHVELYLYADEPGRETSTPRWFSGTQILQGVIFDPAMKQRRYWCSLFLPPANVYMSIPRDRAGKYYVGNMIGVVIITDQEGNILGMRTISGKGKLPASRAKKLIAAVSERRTKKSSDAIPLWPREKTPWQWLEADRFELSHTDLSTTKQQEVPSQPLPPATNDGIEE